MEAKVSEKSLALSAEEVTVEPTEQKKRRKGVTGETVGKIFGEMTRRRRIGKNLAFVLDERASGELTNSLA